MTALFLIGCCIHETCIREQTCWEAFADALPRIEGYSRDRDPAFGYPAERDCG